MYCTLLKKVDISYWEENSHSVLEPSNLGKLFDYQVVTSYVKGTSLNFNNWM